MFGSIIFKDDAWRITCEPHVRTKLKRVFPQVNQRAGETIALSHNAENCRDLLWFIGRYPMAIDRFDILQRGADSHIETQNLVAALLEHRHPPSDFTLALPPRDYQREAAELTLMMRGLLLADDVGLGKTISAICLMARSELLPVLVVTLSHLPSQWASEILRFAPELQVHILKSGMPYDLVPKPRRGQAILFDHPRLPDVIISNYHKLHGWAEHLHGLVRMVVFDEVQEIRRPESNKYAAAKHISSGAKINIGLSATPIYNHGNEFFHVIDVLRPGVLGSKTEFLREWCQDDEKISDPKAFGTYLRREGIMLRRTRKDVGRELPPVTKIPQIVDIDHSVIDRIKGSAMELARIIMSSQEAKRGDKFRASEEFNVLMRQHTGIAKAPYVAEFVRLLLASEERVVLYGWHREVYAIWMEALAEFNPRLYTGTESAKQKEQAKADFISGVCRVLIISLRSGAGLDGLQHACRIVVFGELDWSPGVHHQCIGRVDRDEQLEQVMAYFLISDEGSDPIMADVLGIKRGQIEGVCNPDAELIVRLDTESGNVKRLAESYLLRHGVSINHSHIGTAIAS